MNGIEKASIGVTALVALASALAIAFALCGCRAVYKGGKIVEGTDAFVGLNVPLSEGVMQLEVLNYVSGARFSFDRDAQVRFKYATTNDVSFLSIYSSRTVKYMEAELDPTEGGSTNGTFGAEAALE